MAIGTSLVNLNKYNTILGPYLSKRVIESSRWRVVNNLIVVVIALWGFARHDFQYSKATVFEKSLTEVFSPLQRGTMSLKENIAYFVDHYLMLVDTSKKNVELEHKISELNSQIISLGEIKQENERLKDLLDFGQEIPRKKILAQVVGWDSSSSFKVLRINKGSNDGIEEFSPVVTTSGLVGYVYKTSYNFSDVLTILDPNNRVDTIVSSTRSHGVLEGRSNFQCALKYISRMEKIEIGDSVISAGMGNVYPKGLPVGTISKIDKESYGITQKIQVKPYVNFKKLEEVIVLLKPQDKKVEKK